MGLSMLPILREAGGFQAPVVHSPARRPWRLPRHPGWPAPASGRAGPGIRAGRPRASRAAAGAAGWALAGMSPA